jgi:hypothetical protein
MHRVCLSSTERFSFAYFHDPNFDTFLQPLLPLAGGDYDLEKAAAEDTKEKYKGIYYGAYFTRLLMATYPNRPATKRIILEVENGERRLAVLSALEAAARAKKGNCD